MARLDFSRMTVLVIEDSAFMRSIFVNVLRALGVEKINVAEDGEQAIQMLSPVANMKGAPVAIGKIDLILCDYFMPVVDGAMFLRWLRRSDKSPDRFIPVLMASAAADRDILYTTRDAGMDEFLAKPFSAETLAHRIVSVVEHPRPYIFCAKYFGPNRRRRTKDVAENLRKTQAEDIETVYSGKDMAALKTSERKVWEFRLPRGLRQKLATGQTGEGADEAFDPVLVKAADIKIAEMEGDYTDWVADSIDEIVQSHHRALEQPNRSHTHIQVIHKIAHELRGQGGIFGYPLMTQFGKSLYDVTASEPHVSAQLMDLIDAHINLIKTVTKQKIKGEGGAIGEQLLKSLDEANLKFSSHRRDPHASGTTVLP